MIFFFVLFLSSFAGHIDKTHLYFVCLFLLLCFLLLTSIIWSFILHSRGMIPSDFFYNFFWRNLLAFVFVCWDIGDDRLIGAVCCFFFWKLGLDG